MGYHILLCDEQYTDHPSWDYVRPGTGDDDVFRALLDPLMSDLEMSSAFPYDEAVQLSSAEAHLLHQAIDDSSIQEKSRYHRLLYLLEEDTARQWWLIPRG